MRKFIILLAIIILCMVVLQFISGSLYKARDILLLQSDVSLDNKELELIHDYMQKDSNIVNSSIYSRNHSVISTQRKNLSGFHIYEVDSSYKLFHEIDLIRGRFLWDRDIKEKRKYVVLEKDIAVELFSTVDCIGRKVGIYGLEYSVVGVYKKDQSYASFISSIDKNRVYIPHSLSGIKNTYVLMLRIREGLSPIVEGKVEKDVKSIMGNETIVDNVDIKSRRIIQYIRITYLLLLIILSISLFKVWRPLVKNVYTGFKDELSNSYLAAVLRKYSLRILIHLVPVFVLLLIFYTVIKTIRFDILIDPDIVPYRLIDLKQFRENLINNIIDNNTSQPIVNTFHSLIRHISSLTLVTCIVLVITFYFFTGILKKKVSSTIADLKILKQ